MLSSQISLAIHNNNSHLSSATESVAMTDCCASVVFLLRRGGLQFLFAIVVGVNAAIFLSLEFGTLVFVPPVLFWLVLGFCSYRHRE
jgi:hypothetical protein